MERYRRLIRTTLGEYLVDEDRYTEGGVYVLACYPALGCVYIGISNDVELRIRRHIYSTYPLGNFLRNTMADSVCFRLDILTGNDREWRLVAERKLIRRFQPMFNQYNL